MSGSEEAVPVALEPMLATLVDGPVDRPGWIHEEKYDGHRVLAVKEGARVTLRSRNGGDCTDRFRDVADAVGRLPARSVVLDGEAVAFDDRLVSRFQLLQRGDAPVFLAAFDCPWCDGRDLRNEPLEARRKVLERLVDGSERIFPARRVAGHGAAALRIAEESGWEGVVAKDPASPYVPGRSRHWLKVKLRQQEEFVVGGLTPGRGTRSHFGALLVGAWEGPHLRCVGKVGSGFDERSRAAIAATLAPIARPTPPFDPPPDERGATWVEPRLVAQVGFAEWTDDGRLRQPVYLGLRDDRNPEDCRMPGARA